jgi:hypothetical protein
VVPADVPQTVEQRILEAAVRLPEGGIVTGWGALRLAGAAYFDGFAGPTPQPVPVLLPHTSRLSPVPPPRDRWSRHACFHR